MVFDICRFGLIYTILNWGYCPCYCSTEYKSLLRGGMNYSKAWIILFSRYKLTVNHSNFNQFETVSTFHLIIYNSLYVHFIFLYKLCENAIKEGRQNFKVHYYTVYLYPCVHLVFFLFSIRIKLAGFSLRPDLWSLTMYSASKN